MKFYYQKGATALLITLLIMLVILLSAVIISGIFSTEIQLSQDVGKSIPALYGADSGEEAALSRIIAESDPLNPLTCDTDTTTLGFPLSGSSSPTVSYGVSIEKEYGGGECGDLVDGFPCFFAVTAEGINSQAGLTKRRFTVCLPMQGS